MQNTEVDILDITVFSEQEEEHDITDMTGDANEEENNDTQVFSYMYKLSCATNFTRVYAISVVYLHFC